MFILTKPKHKLTLGSTEYECELLTKAKVIRNENGFDIATIHLDDTTICPSIVTAGTAVKLEVTNEGASYPTTPMFKGKVRFPIINLAPKSNVLTLSCDGSGYGTGQMLVAHEFGTQSIHPTRDTITEIFSDLQTLFLDQTFIPTTGWTASGFTHSQSLEAIADIINYIEFPLKPINQCCNDLIDIETALKAGAAGAHWIVVPNAVNDGTLFLKLLTSSQGAWTKYYGNSQANATLTLGEDYEEANFEILGPEANYIVYYGKWRRPSNGDFWTENQSALWSAMDADTTLSDDAVNYIINAYSLKMLRNNAVGSITGGWYPSARAANWDFSKFTDFNVPTLNFYVRRHCPGAWSNFYVYLETDLGGGAFGYGYTTLTTDVSENDKWYHFSLPLGPYYNVPERFSDFKWYGDGNLDWANVDDIRFRFQCNQNDYICVDGLYFGDADVCRVAYDSDITPYAMKLITDDVGKDDSLKATDDTGLMAQLAYAELLRASKTSYVGWVKTQILPDALAGQWFYLYGDLRAQKIVDEINGDDYTSTLYLTNDVTNGRARMRYEDINKVYADIRPEFQDRQATNIKAGKIDWATYYAQGLAKDY